MPTGPGCSCWEPPGLLLLLIATANLSSLFLARVAARRSELSVRWALGASRGALLIDLAAEAALLTASGAALGLGLAWVGQDVLRGSLPPTCRASGSSGSTGASRSTWRDC